MLEKGNSQRNDFSGKKKDLMATRDDYDESTKQDEEKTNMDLMANVFSNFDFDNESLDEKIEVLSYLSHGNILNILNEFLNKNHNLSSKLKNLIQTHFILS